MLEHLQQSFSNFLLANFISFHKLIDSELQNIPNLPVFNTIYMRKELVNYKCKHTF